MFCSLVHCANAAFSVCWSCSALLWKAPVVSVRLKPGMEMPNKCNHPNISFTVSAPSLVSKSLSSPPAAMDSLIHPCSWEKLQPSPCVWNQGKSVKSAKWSGITRQGTAPYRSVPIHGGSHCWNSGRFFPWLPKALCTKSDTFSCLQPKIHPASSVSSPETQQWGAAGMWDTRAGEAWHKPCCAPKGVCSRTWLTLMSLLI